MVVIQGSNMAECHPVGFQHVMDAKRRGATIIHVDPRFTRTSAVADIHVPLRAGSDIAFLGGIVNHLLTTEQWFREYVVRYTNAATLLDESFLDTEDGGDGGPDIEGLFSGWDPETGTYDQATWQYRGMTAAGAAGKRDSTAAEAEQAGAHGGRLEGGKPPHEDPTLTDPLSVMQVLRRHFARYTPEMVEEVCGVPRKTFLRVAEALASTGTPDRAAAFCYAVGWTQHTVGVQYIRTAAIVQLLLGNIGVSGGGILALRGHASIQGSTDIPTLFNILPGYIPMPQASSSPDLSSHVEDNAATAGFWGNMRDYLVSLQKAWFGDAATADNDWGFGWLPRLTGDHSAYATVLDMLDGDVEGYIVIGENPAVGNANSGLHRMAMAQLDWLVVRDFQLIESATFWQDGPEVETDELVTTDIGTEVFFLPAASHVEKEGTFTNTQRLLQWHDKAVEPQGDCRSDLWFAHQLGLRIREKLADSELERDQPIRHLTWDYPTEGPHDDPSADAVLREINGWDADGQPLSSYTQMTDDGSTAAGCWIYTGCYADGVNQTRRRRPGSEQSWVAPEWGWAWPSNRRILYNRASADPDGNPWSADRAYVWWDAEQRRWTGHDVPDFEGDKPPDYVPPEGATAEGAIGGDHPFVMQADGRGWLFVPRGLVDGPLPTHYEPHESPVRNALYRQQANPMRERFDRPENTSHASGDEPGADAYPYVMTTYRLTEHHTAGAMSRSVANLSELQPEMFCEVSPALAAERGLVNGGWATLISARAVIEARVLVTERLQPLRVGGREIHQIGLPYHWGFRGLSTGDAANDLFALALDPNVHIQEVKAATCDIRPGRRPRGPARRDLVDQHARGRDPSGRSEP